MNRRQWLLSQQPYLRIQLLVEGNGDRVLKILNAGPGAGRGIRFCLAAGEEFVSGYAGPQFGGLLNPGERAEVLVDLKATAKNPLQAVATCWDGADRIHKFSAHDDHRMRRKPRRRLIEATDPERAFEEIYGDDRLNHLKRTSGRGRNSS